MRNLKAHTAKTSYFVTIALTMIGLIALGFVAPTFAQTKRKPAKPILKKPSAVKPQQPKLVPQKVLKPGELLPFFDTVDNPELLSFPRGEAVDASPKPPQMTDFDRDVLKTCGAFGSRVDAEQVRSLFVKYPAVVAQIKEAVDGNVLPRKTFRGKRSPSPEFFDEFVKVWTGQQAFEHVFCGQVKGNQISGLHFAPRYYELQQKGIAGRLPNNQRQEEVMAGHVYTVGIQAKVNGRILTDPKAGYYYGRDALEILLDGTRAYQQFNISSGANNAVCLYKIPLSPEEAEVKGDAYPFPSVFVKNDRGIVTIYPDVTPRRGDRACDQLEE
jgi:Bacterial EndoU nuclease